MQTKTVTKLTNIPALIGFSVVTLLAIAFMVLSFTILGTKIPENYVKTEAEIVEIHEDIDINNDRTYTVYIDYTFDGTEYTHKEYGKYDSSMDNGGKVYIFVNPDNPEQFMTDTSGNIFFVILSAVFLAIGVGGVIYNVKKLNDLKKRSEE